MVTARNTRSNGKELHPLRVRAFLLERGETIASLAREFEVSRALVSRLLNGGRPGVRGRSAQIYRKLVALSQRRAA